MMTFKEWLKLQEIATTTAAVATFSLPVGIGVVRRYPSDFDEKRKKKRKKKK